MVALPQVYNTADLPDSTGGLPFIPAGKYTAIAVESDLKPTSSGNGHMLVLKFVVTQGDYRDTEFTERLNIINPNETAVKIAYQTLARISEAVGLSQTPSDSTQLHNKPLTIEVATKAAEKWKDKDGVERDGKESSFIKKYHPLPAVGVQSVASAPFGQQAAAPVAAKAPWQQ